MKKIMFIVCLFLYWPLIAIADNGSGSLAEQLSAMTKKAFSETSQQMAIKVNLSGKQRMLTQKMSKEALLIFFKIKSEENKQQLQATVKLFSQTLLGLQKGDESLGLTKTSNKEVLQQFNHVTKLWVVFKPDIEHFYTDGVDIKLLKKIAINNLPLLKEMNKVVGLYEKNSGADLSDLATVINLSGKQRMLTQKMSKELLLIAAGIEADKNKDNLKNTISLFDKTLQGLEKGDTDLGLSGTKDVKILAQLAIVKQHWQIFKPLVEKMDASKEVLNKIAELNLLLLKEMNKAVKMYENQSK